MTRYRIPDLVAYDVIEEDAGTGPSVFLLLRPDGRPMVIQGMAAWLWILLAEGAVDLAGEVADATSAERATIAPEIDSWLQSLATDGLLELTDGAAQTSTDTRA